MKITAIITGATGMVGEGVLHECLLCPDVDKVLVINRTPCGVDHPKLKEIIHSDFFNLSDVENQLTGYNACFFCAGVSSIGKKEPEFRRLTYDLTLHVAQTLSRLNPDMTFCYISGAGTDGTEKGKSMWARVKGKTENDLRKLPFKNSLSFRPGFMLPTRGLKNAQKFYSYVGWMYPFFRFVYPAGFSTLKELADGMINSVLKGSSKSVLEVKDFVRLAKQ